MDGSPTGSSVHGILQARILEWVAMPLSRESSQHGSNTGLPHSRQNFYHLSSLGICQLYSKKNLKREKEIVRWMVSSEFWFFSSWTDVERANLRAALMMPQPEHPSVPLQQAVPHQDPGKARTKSALIMNLFCIMMLNSLSCPNTGHSITALLIWLPRFCQSLPGVQSCFKSSKPWLIISWALRSGSWAGGDMDLWVQVTEPNARLLLLHNDSGPEVPELSVFQGSLYCL